MEFPTILSKKVAVSKILPVESVIICFVGTSYFYSATTSDPDGDQILYLFDLGDVGSVATSVSKTQPLEVVKGDQIKPLITRNTGTSGITTRYASIEVVQ